MKIEVNRRFSGDGARSPYPTVVTVYTVKYAESSRLHPSSHAKAMVPRIRISAIAERA